jgi:hypothetical protein
MDRPTKSTSSTSSAQAPRWPSLEQQLRQANAVHGSELEKLIQSNQDASMLRPEEHDHDGIDIPLWLRVHYRKNHPDQPNAPAGPTGDYPEVLENLHEWLKKHQNMNKG